MTTCVYVNGVIASDSRVTSGTDINPVFFKKTYNVSGEFNGEKIVGACIAGNALKKKAFIQWLEKGAPELEYIPRFQDGLMALIMTDVGIWLYSNGDFVEGWDGVSIGSGGDKATGFFNISKRQGVSVTAQDCIGAAICPISGDSCSGGMVQWISRSNKGTTDMPSTISPDDVNKYSCTM